MMELQSTITCPACGHTAIETMPTDACRYIYDCKACGAQLKPKKGRLLRVLLPRFRALSSDPGGTHDRPVQHL
jgi:DNA-directed RNA polymerase subunit RPC12/RpoP